MSGTKNFEKHSEVNRLLREWKGEGYYIKGQTPPHAKTDLIKDQPLSEGGPIIIKQYDTNIDLLKSSFKKEMNRTISEFEGRKKQRLLLSEYEYVRVIELVKQKIWGEPGVNVHFKSLSQQLSIMFKEGKGVAPVKLLRGENGELRHFNYGGIKCGVDGPFGRDKNKERNAFENAAYNVYWIIVDVERSLPGQQISLDVDEKYKGGIKISMPIVDQYYKGEKGRGMI